MPAPIRVCVCVCAVCSGAVWYRYQGEWGASSALNFGKDASPYGVRTFSDSTHDLIFVAASNEKGWSQGGQHFYVLDASGVTAKGPGAAVITKGGDHKLTKEQCAVPPLLLAQIIQSRLHSPYLLRGLGFRIRHILREREKNARERENRARTARRDTFKKVRI